MYNLPYMAEERLRRGLEVVLAPADIKINGMRPWDITVNSDNFYPRVFRDGIIGLGEGYMYGEWDCQDPVELVARFYKGRIDTKIPTDPLLLGRVLMDRMVHGVKRYLDRDSQARDLASTQYNLSTDLFKAFLDDRMLYTCGYWQNATTLEEAQDAKLDLTARKLGLDQKGGMRILDIGGGWGGLAIFMAERYAVNVASISISEEQIKEAEKRRLALPEEIACRIENRFQDYRDVADGPFDRVVVMGMIEHIGHRNFRSIMEVIHRNLAPDGLFLLHTIGVDINGGEEKGNWLERYIFPGSEIPNAADLAASWRNLFVMEDWHNFGADYERTLVEWFKRFDQNWEKIRPMFEPNAERFYRMWKLYLLGCAGGFRARASQLWQIVLSKGGVPGGYQRVS